MYTYDVYVYKAVPTRLYTLPSRLFGGPGGAPIASGGRVGIVEHKPSTLWQSVVCLPPLYHTFKPVVHTGNPPLMRCTHYHTPGCSVLGYHTVHGVCTSPPPHSTTTLTYITYNLHNELAVHAASIYAWTCCAVSRIVIGPTMMYHV